MAENARPYTKERVRDFEAVAERKGLLVSDRRKEVRCTCRGKIGGSVPRGKDAQPGGARITYRWARNTTRQKGVDLLVEDPGISLCRKQV